MPTKVPHTVYILILHHQIPNKFRNDGIVTAISVWQLVIELVMSIGILIYVKNFLHQSMFLDQLFAIFNSAIQFVVMPAFFILADQKFRNSVKVHGGFIAIWRIVKWWN
jgi:hypothetical protein